MGLNVKNLNVCGLYSVAAKEMFLSEKGDNIRHFPLNIENQITSTEM